jgi:hypothetical protein
MFWWRLDGLVTTSDTHAVYRKEDDTSMQSLLPSLQFGERITAWGGGGDIRLCKSMHYHFNLKNTANRYYLQVMDLRYLVSFGILYALVLSCHQVCCLGATKVRLWFLQRL